MSKTTYVIVMGVIVNSVYIILRALTETSFADSLIIGMLAALLILPLVEKIAKDEQ